jgi:Rrf2 family protein
VKLSNKGRYAVSALFDIAFYNQGRPTQVKDIAARQAIPARFLEQIFQDLKRAGLVGSKRGPKGGYSLLKAAGEIRLGDILVLTEGPLLGGDGDGDGEEPPAPKGPTQVCHRVMDNVVAEMGERLRECFNSVTLEDLCRRAEEQGLRRPGSQRIVYMI